MKTFKMKTGETVTIWVTEGSKTSSPNLITKLVAADKDVLIDIVGVDIKKAHISNNINEYLIGVTTLDDRHLKIEFTSTDYFLTMGTFFGYPKCCIDNFETRMYNNIPQAFKGSGFVPCKVHSNKDPKEVIKLIESKRYIDKPFPLLDYGISVDIALLKYILTQGKEI